MKRMRMVDLESRHHWTHSGAIKLMESFSTTAMVDGEAFDAHEAQFEKDVESQRAAAKRKFEDDYRKKKEADAQISGLGAPAGRPPKASEPRQTSSWGSSESDT